MKRSVVVLVAVLVFLTPLCASADVIPTKGDKTDAGAATKVTVELVKRGIQLNEAKGQVRQLTDRDLAYFASRPNRIQLGAGLLLEEWILAGIFVSALAIMTGVVIADAN